MSIEENSAETQGVKAYHVNDAAIEDIDFARLRDLFQLMGFTPNDCTDDGDFLSGVDEEGDYYEVYFYDDEIVAVLDGDEFSYNAGTPAFALAITYGIYEEA